MKISKKRIIIICVIIIAIILIGIIGICISGKSTNKLIIAKTEKELNRIIEANDNEFPSDDFVATEYKFYDTIVGSADTQKNAQKVICDWYDLAKTALYDDYILPVLDDGFVYGFKYGWNGKDASRSDDYIEKVLVFNSDIVEMDGSKVTKFNSLNKEDIKKTLDLIYYINRGYGYAKFIDSKVNENVNDIVYSISYIYYVYGDWGLSDEVNEVVETYTVSKLTGEITIDQEEILSYTTEAKNFKNNLIGNDEIDPDDVRVYETKDASTVRAMVDALTDKEIIAYTDNRTRYRFPEDFVDNELIQCLNRAEVSATSEKNAKEIVKDMYYGYAVENVQEIDFAYNVIIYQNYNVPNPSPANGLTEVLVFKKDYFDIAAMKIGKMVSDANTVRRILNAYYMRDTNYTIDSSVQDVGEYVLYSRYYVIKDGNKIDLCVDVVKVEKSSGRIEQPQKEVIKTILIEE